ncbi:hypothetical protein J6R97_02085 [bacterium]|nr:hypothetical protein [bacterium]
MTLYPNTNTTLLVNSRFAGNTNPAINAPLVKPIETVSKTVENAVDIFIPSEEKNKKSNKRAIWAGSSALVVTALVALLNPKFSSKLIARCKKASQSAGKKFQDSKDNYLKSKFHQTSQKVFDWSVKSLEFTNNFNSAKDLWFKRLCCSNKRFSKVKNDSVRSFLQKVDKGFVGVMSKFHKGVSSWFDSLGKKTVLSKHNKASRQMNHYENLLLEYRCRLSDAEKKEFDNILSQIRDKREVFSKSNTLERLKIQEDKMSDLDKEFIKKVKNYKDGYRKKDPHNKEHFKDNLSFWAEEIMLPERKKLEMEGKKVVEELVGNSEGKKGLYDEAYSLISKKLNDSEKSLLENTLKSTNKKLNRANTCETVEYFDKKRDLVLGSAPTDIVTAVGGIGLSGVAIATADNKEDRISKLLTGGLPIITGIGASLAFTAMLFSGIKGMLYGAGASIALSKFGSAINKHIFNKDIDAEEEFSNITEQKRTA